MAPLAPGGGGGRSRMLERVEKYEIIGEIGHGGMATVYRARDTRLDRLVALKVMHPHLQGAKEARQRFAREAVTVARLHHPSILEIYDYSGEDSEVRFIATELLTGPTLKVFAEQNPDLPAEIAACIALQVARALGAAHAEGVVHRDVKPENIMLHENKGVKLTDFGIAQLVDVQGMTTTGQVLGSPAHMAPEQIEGRECDARSDLFSLGTVLYMLATGQLPFVGTNPHHVLKRIMDGKFADPLQLRPTIGSRLAAIIRRLLELDPASRYANAGALAHDLSEFVAESGISSPDATLAQYLDDPAGFGAKLRTDSIEHLTALGEAAQTRGQVPVALDHFNRVLALDDGNTRVLSAVQRIGKRAARRRLLARVGSVAAACCVLGAAIYAVAASNPALPVVPPAVRRDQPVQRTAPVTATTPRPRAMPAPKAAKPPTRPRRDGNSGGSRPTRPAAGESGGATGGPRKVTFNPYPGNVSIGIDGAEPRAFGPSFREVELEPGTHRFKFVGAHDCCIDEEVSIKIPPGDDPFAINQRLKFRPAGLYVVTDAPANVVVDHGAVSGRSRSVIQISDMSDLVETHHIRITADGHEDKVQDVRLQAGQVVTVEVPLSKRREDS
ncbi:MAG TPA: protein kinase [Polyangiales bacterium]|nr:protein kinase [Polyangiales bacterium]